jgi:hypothetical protein
MLSERDRESLREIEGQLRDSDGDFVAAFDILTRVGGQRPPSRLRPPRPAAARPAPPAAAPPARSPIAAVRWILGSAVVLPMLVLGLAANTGDAASLGLAAVFGATLGLAGCLAAAAVRARRH